MASTSDNIASEKTRASRASPTARIDEAVGKIEEHIVSHRKSAAAALRYALVFCSAIILTVFLYWFYAVKDESLEKGITFAAVFAIVTVAGFFVSIYRSHLRETSRSEQVLAGFLRLRVISDNPENFALSEVVTAFSSGAFDLQSEHGLFSRPRRLENPVPGHPATEAASKLIDKIFEQIEITFPRGK